MNLTSTLSLKETVLDDVMCEGDLDKTGQSFAPFEQEMSKLRQEDCSTKEETAAGDDDGHSASSCLS